MSKVNNKYVCHVLKSAGKDKQFIMAIDNDNFREFVRDYGEILGATWLASVAAVLDHGVHKETYLFREIEI